MTSDTKKMFLHKNISDHGIIKPGSVIYGYYFSRMNLKYMKEIDENKDIKLDNIYVY